MAEFSGLQIEVRCVKCGRLPVAGVTLYELQNHLYLCNFCREEEEHKGRQIAWIGGMRSQMLVSPDVALPTVSQPLPVTPQVRVPARSALPPGSIFALLELPVETPLSQLTEGLKRRMTAVMRQPASSEQRQMIQQLREWREKLQDEQAFEEYRANLRTVARHEGQALMVGGQPVLNVLELLTACESSQEGWADGERYMRTGQLRQWIIFQLEDRALAEIARHYQNWTQVSDFRALNEMLYAFISERPFRFYAEEKWESVEKRVDGRTVTLVPTASTPAQLARICDGDWERGERHLYAGSMVYWLASSQHLADLDAYFQQAVAGYANGADRGVGLELLLEYAVPELPKPRLAVTFDGQPGAYRQNLWDREIPHRDIPVTITNTTRGFVSVQIDLGQQRASVSDPAWLFMSPNHLGGRPGAGLPVTRTITLERLSQLKRGHLYTRQFCLSLLGPYGTQPQTQQFPIRLKTMRFFQGFRGLLWRWGLRGGVPALLLNFLAGALLAFLPLGLFSILLNNAGLFNPGPVLSVGTVVQALFLNGMQFLTTFLGARFLLAMGIICSLAGYFVGYGKGHTDYTEIRGRSGYRKGGFWLALLAALVLVIWDQGYQVVNSAFQANPAYYGTYLIYAALAIVGASLILWIVAWVITWSVASIRLRLERYLRQRYSQLFYPVERR